MEFLIIVDAQNDFITGKLAVPRAEEVVKNIKTEIFRHIEDYLSTHNPSVRMIYTHDVHTESKYLSTIEGSRLPVHCLKGTNGCELCTEMIYANYDRDIREHHIFKEVFAFMDWKPLLEFFSAEERSPIEVITLMGFCTDICVLSNAIVLRSLFPNIPIRVKADCCAGSTPELHEAALKIMAANLIDII